MKHDYEENENPKLNDQFVNSNDSRMTKHELLRTATRRLNFSRICFQRANGPLYTSMGQRPMSWRQQIRERQRRGSFGGLKRAFSRAVFTRQYPGRCPGRYENAPLALSSFASRRSPLVIAPAGPLASSPIRPSRSAIPFRRSARALHSRPVVYPRPVCP